MRTCANLTCGGPPSRLGGLREPAIRQAPGGGPPPEVPRTPGQPRDKVKGKTNEVVGKATGDRSQQMKGKAQQVKGSVKNAVGAEKEEMDRESDRR
ncbi:MAG: CsbD family protein [Nitriliruptoraceae bacterium]